MSRIQMKTTVASLMFVIAAVAQPDGMAPAATPQVLTFDDLPYNTNLSTWTCRRAPHTPFIT